MAGVNYYFRPAVLIVAGQHGFTLEPLRSAALTSLGAYGW